MKDLGETPVRFKCQPGGFVFILFVNYYLNARGTLLKRFTDEINGRDH